MRNLQIGVIGSMADIKLQKSSKQLAQEVGKEIAKSGAILIFAFEGDFDSVSTIAAQVAQDVGGQTATFVLGDEKQNLGDLRSMQIITGQQRGGGREFPFILSCDAIISICGGSGTLMEMAMAYQAGIPVVALQNSGGWSQKLANSFLDERKRQKIIGVKTAREAVTRAIEVVRASREKISKSLIPKSN